MEMEKWCCNKIQNRVIFAVRDKKKVKTSTICRLVKTVHSTRYIYIYTHTYIYIYLIPLCTEHNIKTQQFNKEWLIIHFHSAPWNWCCGTMYTCYWATEVLSELQWAQVEFIANIARRNCQKPQHFQFLYLHTV